MTEINKLYFVTHPAYPVADPSKQRRRSPATIAQFLQGDVEPIIQQAMNENHSAVVVILTDIKDVIEYIQTFRQTHGRNPEGLSESRARKAAAIEKRFVARLTARMGDKKVVVITSSSAFAAPALLEEALRRKRLFLKRPVHSEALGSYRKWCAKNYPDHCHSILNLLGELRVSQKGTLPENRERLLRPTRRRLP